MRIAYVILSVKQMFFLVYISFCNVMNLRENRVAARQTFVFLGSLANEYPAKQDVECEARIRELIITQPNS